MELPVLLWRMEKVSVATRFPFMKTPKEPESTVWLGESFSGVAHALAANNVNKSPPVSHRPCFDVFMPNRYCMLPPLQPLRHPCRSCQCGTKPSDKKTGVAHKVRETVSHSATADAPVVLAGNG